MNHLIKRPNILNILSNIGERNDVFSDIIDELYHFHGKPICQGIDNPSFSPDLNFIEKEKEYLLNLEIPGIEQQNVEINIKDNTLVITGEKKYEKKEEKENVYINEISYGSFRREIPLNKNCNQNNIEASYNNGILQIKIPKLEQIEEKSRKIEIK